MNIVVLGLSLSSGAGNRHAAIFRALLAAFAHRGHRVLFLERDTPRHAANRDLPDPDFCELAWYHSVGELADWTEELAAADAVIVGSSVPDGREIAAFVQALAGPRACFYDVDAGATAAARARGIETPVPAPIPGFALYFAFTAGRDRWCDNAAHHAAELEAGLAALPGVSPRRTHAAVC